MSSYINLYLLPKQKEGDTITPKPLLLNSWSRSSNIYQAFYEHLNPVFAGNDEEPKYKEIKPSNLQALVLDLKHDLEAYKERIQAQTEIINSLKNISREILEEYRDEFMSSREYIKGLEDTIQFFESLYEILSDLEYSGFEKILINYD